VATVFFLSNPPKKQGGAWGRPGGRGAGNPPQRKKSPPSGENGRRKLVIEFFFFLAGPAPSRQTPKNHPVKNWGFFPSELIGGIFPGADEFRSSGQFLVSPGSVSISRGGGTLGNSPRRIGMWGGGAELFGGLGGPNGSGGGGPENLETPILVEGPKNPGEGPPTGKIFFPVGKKNVPAERLLGPAHPQAGVGAGRPEKIKLPGQPELSFGAHSVGFGWILAPWGSTKPFSPQRGGGRKGGGPSGMEGALFIWFAPRAQWPGLVFLEKKKETPQPN